MKSTNTGLRRLHLITAEGDILGPSLYLGDGDVGMSGRTPDLAQTTRINRKAGLLRVSSKRTA